MAATQFVLLMAAIVAVIMPLLSAPLRPQSVRMRRPLLLVQLVACGEVSGAAIADFMVQYPVANSPEANSS